MASFLGVAGYRVIRLAIFEGIQSICCLVIEELMHMLS